MEIHFSFVPGKAAEPENICSHIFRALNITFGFCSEIHLHAVAAFSFLYFFTLGKWKIALHEEA